MTLSGRPSQDKPRRQNSRAKVTPRADTLSSGQRGCGDARLSIDADRGATEETPVKQLTGLDASFLYMETPTTFGHVNGLGIYNRPHPEFNAFDAVYAKFASMVHEVEPLRRKLATVPFNLDHPYWIDDEDFDLDFHVRHIGIPPPGNDQQLAEQVARIIGRPMDRSRPLWEVYVMEGLPDNRWGLFAKYHHATIDGAAGVILLNMLTSRDPSAEAPPPPTPWTGESMPSDVELLRRTALNLTRNPVKSARLQLRLVQTLAAAAGVTSLSSAASQTRALLKAAVSRNRTDDASNEQGVSMPVSPAPPTPWNRTITAHRRFAMRSASLHDLKKIKDATGGTLNDVVMAVCAGALRAYLLSHDALPDKPLRAMVPVSIRTGDEEDVWSNRVSGIIADLPTDCDDPLERVARCRVAMAAAKRQFELVPADALAEATQITSPVLAASALRLASRLRLADLVNLPTNVVISNVPGPRQPLYFAGAQMQNYIPVSIVTDGMGLNITVHSYLDRLDFGLVACRELVPDLWDMVDLHIAEIETLLEATAPKTTTPAPSPKKGKKPASKVKPS
jgi:diacylglycerol O-acyltransferase / wax synthase